MASYGRMICFYFKLNQFGSGRPMKLHEPGLCGEIFFTLPMPSYQSLALPCTFDMSCKRKVLPFRHLMFWYKILLCAHPAIVLQVLGLVSVFLMPKRMFSFTYRVEDWDCHLVAWGFIFLIIVPPRLYFVPSCCYSYSSGGHQHQGQFSNLLPHLQFPPRQ